MGRTSEGKRLAISLLLGLWLAFLAQDLFADQSPKELFRAISAAQEAGIPSAIVSRLVAYGNKTGLESSAVASFLEVVTRAYQEGIPLQPFLSKIEEGIAKRAPSSTVRQVLERKLEDYRFARRLIAEVAKKRGLDLRLEPDYQVRLTETLCCAIDRDSVVQVLESVPSTVTLPELTHAVEVMAVLEQNHFDRGLAQKIVLAGVAHGYFASNRQDFGYMLVAAKRKGTPESRITSIAIQAIERSEPLQAIAQHLGVASDDLSYGPMVGGCARGVPKGMEGRMGCGMQPGAGRMGASTPSAKEGSGQ